MQRESRLALAMAMTLLLGSTVGACRLLPGADAAIHEVTAVAPGEAAGSVQVTVTDYDVDPPKDWKLILDERGEITHLSPPPAPPSAHLQACAGAECYRVVTGELRVQVSHDSGATFGEAWRVASHTRRHLAADYARLGDPLIHLSSRSVVVRSVARGHVVFVANGRDGVLYRDVVGGWHRLGMPTGGEGVYFKQPPRLDTDPEPLDARPFVGGAAFLVVLLVGAITGAIRRALPPLRAAAVLGIAAVAGTIDGLAARFPDVGMFPGYFYSAVIILPTLACAMVIAFVVAVTAGRPTRPREVPPGLRRAPPTHR